MIPDEMNRFCAEALGWQLKPFKGARTVYAENDEWCADPITEKYITDVWHVPSCICPPNIITDQRCVSTKLPDFLTSESANAMLLEAMKACSGYVKFVPTREGGYWDSGWWDKRDASEFSVNHPDRKTAIVLAFIAWIKAGGKV